MCCCKVFLTCIDIILFSVHCTQFTKGIQYWCNTKIVHDTAVIVNFNNASNHVCSWVYWANLCISCLKGSYWNRAVWIIHQCLFHQYLLIHTLYPALQTNYAFPGLISSHSESYKYWPCIAEQQLSPEWYGAEVPMWCYNQLPIVCTLNIDQHHQRCNYMNITQQCSITGSKPADIRFIDIIIPVTSTTISWYFAMQIQQSGCVRDGINQEYHY